jgi:YD repeat-containing protein
LVASATTPGGAKTVYSYLHNGDVASITDPAGLVTDYTYDGLGRVLSKKVISDTFSQGLTTSYSYDAAGHVLTETDPGVTDRVTGKVHTKVTTTGYDADGDALTVAVSDATGGDATRTTTNTYDGSDRLASVTDPSGAVTSYGYDALGDKTKQVDAVGTETDYAYDARGKLITVTLHNYTGDPANPSPAVDLVQSSRAYDPAGRLATVTDSLGRTTSYTYFDDGHLATVTVSPTTAGTGGTEVDNRSYDLAGNLIAESKGGGQASSVYSVDAANRDVVVADQYSTDSSGNPLYRTTTTTFDPDDHPVSVSKTQQGSATVETVDYTYDPLGRTTSQTIHDSAQAQSSSAALAGAWPMADATTTTAADSSATPAMRAPIQVPMDGRVYAASAAQTWTSAAVRLIFQTDGNLVAYRTSDGAAIWNSATAGNPNATLALQTDGNLVIYSAASGGTALWATGTVNNPGDILQLADNGDFTITNTNGTRLWAAGTAQTGYNHPGTLHGGVSWSADHGGSGVFDGTSGNISAGGPVVDTTKSFTVTAWAKANSNGSLGAVVAQNGKAQAQLLLYADAGSTHNWNFAMGSADTGWNCDWVSSGVAIL